MPSAVLSIFKRRQQMVINDTYGDYIIEKMTEHRSWGALLDMKLTLAKHIHMVTSEATAAQDWTYARIEYPSVQNQCSIRIFQNWTCFIIVIADYLATQSTPYPGGLIFSLCSLRVYSILELFFIFHFVQLFFVHFKIQKMFTPLYSIRKEWLNLHTE